MLPAVTCNQRKLPVHAASDDAQHIPEDLLLRKVVHRTH